MGVTPAGREGSIPNGGGVFVGGRSRQIIRPLAIFTLVTSFWTDMPAMCRMLNQISFFGYTEEICHNGTRCGIDYASMQQRVVSLSASFVP